MITRNSYGRGPVKREADNKPKYVVPKETLSAPEVLCKICVYTSSFKDERGIDTLSYQTLDLGFICRVSSVYPPDNDGYIEYDPLHTLFNTKGTYPTLYILKSDRINRIREQSQNQDEEHFEDIEIPLTDDVFEENLPF